MKRHSAAWFTVHADTRADDWLVTVPQDNGEMRVEAVVLQRSGFIIVQTSTKARNLEWHLDTELVALPADADDEHLGQIILDALQRVGSKHPESEMPAAVVKAYFEQPDALVGAHGAADFARGCDAVAFLRYDDAFTMMPTVLRQAEHGARVSPTDSSGWQHLNYHPSQKQLRTISRESISGGSLSV